jgi:filamentous hemagglutinin
MANAHAEVEVIQKASDQGLTQGRDMRIVVEGEPVCTYCRSDIRNMADQAGLNRVEVYEAQTGKTLVWERRPDGMMGKVKER